MTHMRMSAPVPSSELRPLAENARSGHRSTWWLWDETPSIDTGPMLGFARAATPETVLALLDEIDRLEAIAEAAAVLVDPPFGSLDPRAFYAVREALDV